MELDLSSQGQCYMKKHLFNLKTHRSDGLILQVHHSYSNSGRENKRYRFTTASFNNNGTHLAVTDYKGHIFIINLNLERYWQLPHVGLPTVISFPVLKEQELLIGLDNTPILFIHIETGNITGVLYGHSLPATQVSYSDDGYYYLTSCHTEAVIWDSSTYTQIHKLSLKQEVYLKKVLFMPVTNHILACFQDDTMHIWKFGSFECIKQIVPETWKTQHLKTIAITKNGRAMVIGGHNSNLVIFCLDTWAIKKVVELPEHISGVKQIEFLSQVFDGGANKILVLLSTSQELFFFDIEALFFFKWIYQINGLTAKFQLSCNGKYLASILTTGEVNIYLVEKVLWNKKISDLEEGYVLTQNLGSRNYSSNSKRTQKTYESLSSIQKEIKEILDVKKLLPILKQYGEYPQIYRILIWKTILKLPEDQESYISLSMKESHPSYSKLELKYPLTNKSLCNSLKKLLSNLSYWCPLFGEVDFLPEFVFPFVKLFHSNPLICFEVVATVIVNWCQNWFEFFPFPPVNLLSSLESVLGYHDPDLLEFYLTNEVTSSITMCPLFHTAFSEVLAKTEWLKLWDHILSNEPSYFFMAIIAYNVVCRNAVKGLKNLDEIKKYFHTQNSIDLKMLISKAYHFLKETPENIHIRPFFAPFRSLGSGGTYTSFLAYPKLIIDSSTEKLQSIRSEKEKILDEKFKALNIKKVIEEKLHQDTTMEDKEKIYEELEEKIRKTVDEEEDRLLIERQKLQNLRQELKLRELEILENTRDKALNEKIRRKEMEFERLLRDISKRKHREKVELDTIEKEIRNYYSDLLLRKCQLEMELGFKCEGNVVGNLEKQREKLRNDLTELQYEWDTSYHSKRIDLNNKISTIKGLVCDVEAEIAKEMAEKNFEKQIKGDRMSIEELKSKVKSLEEEVEKLLKENLNNLQNKKEEQKILSSRFSTKAEHLKKLEKKTSNSKYDVKNTGISKTRMSSKSFIKKVSGSKPYVKRLANGNTRPSKPKLTKSSIEKQEIESLQEDRSSPMNTARYNFASVKPQSSHLKSKFTQPAEFQFYSPDSPRNSEDCYQTNSSENYDVKFHQQPQGDCVNDKKFSKTHKSLKNVKKRSAPSSKIKKENPPSDSVDEILKAAFKTRSQIIEDAKKQNELQ